MACYSPHLVHDSPCLNMSMQDCSTRPDQNGTDLMGCSLPFHPRHIRRMLWSAPAPTPGYLPTSTLDKGDAFWGLPVLALRRQTKWPILPFSGMLWQAANGLLQQAAMEELAAPNESRAGGRASRHHIRCQEQAQWIHRWGPGTTSKAFGDCDALQLPF